MNHDPASTTARIERQARRRVALKTGFAIHALVYLLVNGGLALLFAAGLLGAGSGRIHTVSLPIWGWALGLAIHGIVVAFLLAGDGLRQRMFEREVESLRRRSLG